MGNEVKTESKSSTITSATNIDLKIFEHLSQKCNKSTTEIISKCAYMQRLVMSLKYFDLLMNENGKNSKQTKISKELLIHFCNESYTNYLDDFAHFMKEHGSNDALVDIEKELKQKYIFNSCNTFNCNKLQRHYRSRAEDKSNNILNNNIGNDDGNFCFYMDFFDNLHHYIFHLFTMGLRTTINEKPTNNDESDGIDKIFEKKRDLIKTKQNKLESNIERFKHENNKYNLCVNTITNKKQNDTFLNGIFTVIQKHNEFKLIQMLNENDYDSDAIKYDLYDFDSDTKLQSNIYNHIKIEESVHLMKNYIRTIQLSAKSFSTGLVFYYWDFYKNLDANWLKDSFVSSHYESLKQEILLSGFINMDQWTQKIVFKADKHFKSDTVKEIKANYPNNEQHGIKDNDPISKQHLQCVIIYCDWSELQTHFSSTFRKKNEFESIETVKTNNSKYYHLSKGLIEAVVDFGINGHGNWYKEYEYWGKPEWYTISPRAEPPSPFYCGLSVVLNISSFATYLNGPCSTSKNIEVAINFAKRDGMIMQLINDESLSQCQNYFDCSWISNYSDENERLFMCTTQKLKIQSITIIKSAKNFKKFFRPLYIFDHMISGVCTILKDTNIKILPSDIKILNKLINNKLNNSKNKAIDPYIIDTFDLFLNRKTEIRINIYEISEYLKDLSDLILYSVCKTHYAYYLGTRSYGKWMFMGDDVSESSYVNVINTKILPIFPNLTKVIIETTSTETHEYLEEYAEYRFSLLSFLSSIESYQSVIKYSIQATGRYDWTIKNSHDSWLNNIITESTQQTFNDKGWNINVLDGEIEIIAQMQKLQYQ